MGFLRGYPHLWARKPNH
jgi:hypothetical protein